MLSLEERIRALRGCPLFESLPGEALRVLAMTVRPVRCPAGDILIAEGEAEEDDSGAYVLAEGEAVAFKVVDGTRVEIARFVPPDVLGEFELLARVPRSASVEVVKDSVFLRVDHPTFEQIVRAHPDVALRIMRFLVLRLLDTRDRFLVLAVRREADRG